MERRKNLATGSKRTRTCKVIDSPRITKTVPEQKIVPRPEDIARLAYSYWTGRGCQGGSPEEDWLRAEKELKGR